MTTLAEMTPSTPPREGRQALAQPEPNDPDNLGLCDTHLHKAYKILIRRTP